MSASQRFTTPPPCTKEANDQLLTPPPTGHSKPKGRCYSSAEYGELSGDDQHQSSSYALDDIFHGAASLAGQFSTTCKDYTEQVIYKDAHCFNASFAFMKLPLNVRKQIYEHLLVVPAIICVRQNHTAYHKEVKAFLYPEVRIYRPGIAYALPQLTVAGPKFRYSCFTSANINILYTSKEVYAEAKRILYGDNYYEILMPSPEMSPPFNLSVPLFPRGCQCLIRHLVIRTRAFYAARWLIQDRYTELKNAYRGLESLTLIVEMEHTDKGLGRILAKGKQERWVPYVKRLHMHMAVDIMPFPTCKVNVPIWMDLRVLFDGERYDEVDEFKYEEVAVGEELDEKKAMMAIKRGLAEAFEMFKKGGVDSTV